MVEASTKSFFSRQYATLASEKRTHTTVAGGNGEYDPPRVNQELWKQFGCDTDAGRALRSLYRLPNTNTSGVTQTRLRTTSGSKFSRDSVDQQEKETNKAKRCPQKDGQVAVPRVGLHKKEGPVPPILQTRGRKTLDAILTENNGFEEVRRAVPPAKKGRDNEAAKVQLAAKFTYGDAYMTPGELRQRREDREDEDADFRRDHENLGKADVQFVQDLERDIREKERFLSDIDARMDKLGKPGNRTAWKDRIRDDKHALDLEKQLDQDKQDLRRFRQLAGIGEQPS